MIRVIVIGDGKMGRALAGLVPERGCELVAVLGEADMPQGVRAGVADVAIEFTEPLAAAGNVRACLAAGIPVVSGTTGWDGALAAVKGEVVQAGGTLLHSPNFSIGMHLFARLVELAARGAGSGPFAAHLVETHHAAKLDAPSGTAKSLATLASGELGRELPVTSVRVGFVPGTHELVLDGQFEQIRLVHEARDRRVFADGAIAAAKWLVGRHGVFGMDDFVRDQLAQKG